jgi:Cu+-exporting ATPase
VGRAYAEALEEDKAAVVSRLRSKGRRVAVLGEGERDVCALSRSDLGLCSAGCSPLAEAASDFTLPRADLDSFEEALALGLDIRGAIRRNFLWMFSLHALMIPASATALYLRRAMPPGIFAASAATALAAVLVNSARLARRRTPPG